MKQLAHLIQQLKEKIQLNSIENVLEILSEFESYKGDDWKNYFEANPSTTVLFQENQLKLILIYWEGLKRSSKHGHPPGGGLMRVLFGKLKEIRFDAIEPEKELGRYDCDTGALSYIHDELALHVVENPDKIPAVSLHVYSMGKQA